MNTSSSSPIMTTCPEFRAAVCLNNMAVSLLENHCYNQAQATLRSAVFVMKTAVLPRQCGNGGGDVSSSSSTTKVDVELMLRQADKRMASPKPSTKGGVAQIQAQSVMNLPSTLLRPPAANDDAFPSFYALRIEDTFFDNDDADDSAANGLRNRGELEAACMLHNYGVAWTCLALLMGARAASTSDLSNHQEVAQTLQAATSLFDLSLSILEERTVNSPCQIILTLYVLSTMERVIMIAGQTMIMARIMTMDRLMESLDDIEDRRLVLLESLDSLVAVELFASEAQTLPAPAA